MKVKRFGWNNFHPDDPEKTPNWRLVEKEMKDVEKRIEEVRTEMTADILNGLIELSKRALDGKSYETE